MAIRPAPSRKRDISSKLLGGEAEHPAERADGQPGVADAQGTDAVAEQAEERGPYKRPAY
jgi:hypothetical protein